MEGIADVMGGNSTPLNIKVVYRHAVAANITCRVILKYHVVATANNVCSPNPARYPV